MHRIVTPAGGRTESRSSPSRRTTRRSISTSSRSTALRSRASSPTPAAARRGRTCRLMAGRSSSSATRRMASTSLRCRIQPSERHRASAARAGRDLSPSIGQPVRDTRLPISDRRAPLLAVPDARPTSWTPVVESDSDQLRVGASRRLRRARLSRVRRDGHVAVSRSRRRAQARAATPDWQRYYAYARWRPTFFRPRPSLDVVLRRTGDRRGTPHRPRCASARCRPACSCRSATSRISHQALVVPAAIRRRVTRCRIGTLSRHRVAVRARWRHRPRARTATPSAPSMASRSAQRWKLVRRALGAFADATIAHRRRSRVPAVVCRHHVAAVRLAAGASSGDVHRPPHVPARRPFPNRSVIDFGRDAVSLLRGFAANTFAGSHVALVNADYRWPIARPQRGVGTWPLLFHTRARGGVCRRRPCLDARLPRGRHQGVGRRRALSERRRRLLLSVHRHGRRGMGPRRQRARTRSGDACTFASGRALLTRAIAD